MMRQMSKTPLLGLLPAMILAGALCAERSAVAGADASRPDCVGWAYKAGIANRNALQDQRGGKTQRCQPISASHSRTLIGCLLELGKHVGGDIVQVAMREPPTRHDGIQRLTVVVYARRYRALEQP